MIFIPLVLVIFALVALVAWQQQQFGLREKEWTLERAQLLTCIQHPDIVHASPVVYEPDEPFGVSAPEPDDIDLVGTVQTFDGSGD